ncbi:MAG: chitobiase/beta-hexosaminidase C-terminal domain-containing protein [Rikenellaceae bacterium]|nr:chitobiase/beta-hexosaminidase C-terminal domain-containing protein [Rikenellaceae bacterium]
MRKIFNTFAYAAIAALALSSCAKEKLQPADELTGKLVTVHFGTENTDPSTKATLTPDDGETAFQAAWENGDQILISYSYDGGNPSITTGTCTGTWKDNSFQASLTGGNGDWIYDAAYPVPAKDNSVDFGSNRTQKGNAYNSKYDIMIGSAVAEGAEAGKDAQGNDIIFEMDRQTAIAYFHFTSDIDEPLVSATLKVTDGAIANSAASISELFKFVAEEANDLKEINLTFEEGTAPSAKDFQLWFNVLPTFYSSMTLTVETATKTFIISKSTSEEYGEYKAGKLYKVKKDGISWTDKGGSVTPSEVTDVITADKLAATGTSYTDFSNVKISSNAVYAGNNAMNSGAIQLRSSNSNSGIVSTTSGGKATKVSVVWASNTTKGRTIDIYGNDSPYSNAADLYSSTTKGTKIGSIVCGTSTEVVIEGNYPYVGIRSNSGALYLESVSITWESGSSEPTPGTYSVSCATVTGGTLSATPASAEAGTEISLNATPDEGYEFNNDWSVIDSDNVEVKVADGKFTMPAKNVTVSGSFSKVDYTITKVDSEGGSFIVKNNGVVVTKAQIGETITLEATPAEGYQFDKWTVTNESTNSTVYVNENTFTMPGANVTVEANFLKSDVIPVYASLAELVAAGEPTTDGVLVTVTLTNEEITKFYTTKAGERRGVFFTIGTQEIELFGDIACPTEWKEGGWVSGTLTKCKWMLYKTTWELCPTDWTELSYAAPCETPVITLEGADATITCATEGATIRYTLDESEPTETSTKYTSSVTLKDGQTIKAKAFLEGHKSSAVVSKKYTASPGGEASYSFDITVSSFSNQSWSSYATKTATITGSDNKTYSITGESMAYNADYIQIRKNKNSKIYNTTPIGKIRSIVITDSTQATFTVKSGSTKEACNTSVSAESDKRTFNFTGDASYFTIEVGNTTIAHVTKITVTYE